MFIISCAVTFVNKNRNPFFESELHKFVDEEVLPRARQDTAERYVNSATCVAEFIHAPSLPKEKYGTLEWVCRIFGGDGEIWTLAPIARPTPLAGAPLHHLSTSPFGEVIIFATCHSIISSFAGFVKGFLKVLATIFTNPNYIADAACISHFSPANSIISHQMTVFSKIMWYNLWQGYWQVR